MNEIETIENKDIGNVDHNFMIDTPENSVSSSLKEMSRTGSISYIKYLRKAFKYTCSICGIYT